MTVWLPGWTRDGASDTRRAALADPFVQTGVLARASARSSPASCCAAIRHDAWSSSSSSSLALTALLYHHGIVPYEIAPDGTPAFERVFVALAKIIWWINARLGADRLHARVPDLRAAAARGPADPGPRRRHHLSRRRAVGRRLCLQRAGRHADRHVRRVRHHPRPCPAEHAGRRLLRHRPQSQPAPTRSATGSC